MSATVDIDSVLHDDEENRSTLDRLHQRLQSESFAPAVFVGAGTSLALGYPTWKGLLKELHDLALEAMSDESADIRGYFRHLKNLDDYPWRAEEYRQAIGDERRYLSMLRRRFRPSADIRKARRSPAARTLDALVSLPVRHFFTTNYDEEIETAYRRVHRRSLPTVDWTDTRQAAEIMNSWDNSTSQPSCIHLHGHCYDEESIVLTESDYQRAYFRTAGNAQRLAAILLMHPVLFLGFSLSDPDLMALLRQANMLGFRGSRHFALVSSDDSPAVRNIERANLRAKFGIAPIFFRAGRNYSGLRVVLEHLCRPLQERAPASIEMPPAKITENYVCKHNPRFPDDPLRGRFGGCAEKNGWHLSASIERDSEDPYYFNVTATVRPANGVRKRVRGAVHFYMHPTFSSYVYRVTAYRGMAKLSFWCYGSFTMGAKVFIDGTLLELDLAEIEGAPLDFQIR